MSPDILRAVGDQPVVFLLIAATGLYMIRKAIIPIVLVVALALMLLGLIHLVGVGT